MPDEPKPLRETRLETIATSYLHAQIAAPDTARDRADRSYAIAGAIGTLLLGAGVISGIGGSSTLVTTLGIGALLLWAAAAALFVHAVGIPFRRILPEHKIEPTAFADKALEFARAETEAIERRSKRARWMTIAAALFTLLALVAAALETGEKSARTLILTPRGAATAAQACGAPGRSASTRVRVEVDPSALSDEWVTVTLQQGDCHELRLPRDDILGVSH